VPRERQQAQSHVACNADRRHRHAQQHRIRAMIHYAAVPALVDVAGLRSGLEVDIQSQR